MLVLSVFLATSCLKAYNALVIGLRGKTHTCLVLMEIKRNAISGYHSREQ